MHFRLIPNYPSQWTYKHTFPSCSEGSISDQFSLTFFWSVARKIYKTTSMNDTMSVYLSEVLKVSQYSEPRPTTTLFMRPHSFDLSGDILPFNSDTFERHLNAIRALRRRGWGHWRGLSLNCISKQLAHKLSTRRICKDYPPSFLTPKNQAKEQIWNYPRFLFFFGISFSSSNRQKTGWPGVSTFFETQQIERTRERRAARQRRTPGGGRKLALIPH